MSPRFGIEFIFFSIPVESTASQPMQAQISRTRCNTSMYIHVDDIGVVRGVAATVERPLKASMISSLVLVEAATDMTPMLFVFRSGFWAEKVANKSPKP